MIALDTSALVDSLGGLKRSELVLRGVLDRGEVVFLPVLTLYEWLRGPRTPLELKIQELLFPAETAIPFGTAEARLAARLYRSVARPRTREFDLGIAATAIAHDAELWTLNPRDFADIPGLRLLRI